MASPRCIAGLAPFVLITAFAGCDAEGDPLAGLEIVSDDPTEDPIQGLPRIWRERFDAGDVAFELAFRDPQGLGPVYIRQACASCHASDARGPGAVRKMVIVEADGRTPTADQSALAYGHTIRPQVAGTATHGVVEPEGVDSLLVTTRFGPAVFGRGYMEAVADAEIEAAEATQAERDDGISGRIHRVAYRSRANPETDFHRHQPGEDGLIGRFGLKARIATVDDFVADAFQGDMGLTSPLRPDELPLPGEFEDGRPGIDIDAEMVNDTAAYVRLLAIPRRDEPDATGFAAFEAARCSVCHLPSMQTRDDYPIPTMAGLEVFLYTDFLLHDMGESASDGLQEFDAAPSEWKTPPLMGLRHLRNFMHDGRARTVEEAIEMHAGPGSEANDSIDRYLALPPAERAALIAFVKGL